MDFSSRISQKLHDEHEATLALMERLHSFIGRHGDSCPDSSDGAVARLFIDLATSLEIEVQRHFDFEEQHLFTYLETAGEPAIGAHLTEEHMIIRPLGARIAALARDASSGGFDQVGWNEFRRIGQDLSERINAHVQKEEMALLPLLEDTLDAETEDRLYRDYVEDA